MSQRPEEVWDLEVFISALPSRSGDVISTRSGHLWNVRRCRVGILVMYPLFVEDDGRHGGRFNVRLGWVTYFG